MKHIQAQQIKHIQAQQMKHIQAQQMKQVEYIVAQVEYIDYIKIH